MLELAGKAAALDPTAALLAGIVGGALGAAVLTVVAGFVSSKIANSREHKRWVREQRLDAYRSFFRTAEVTFALDSEERNDWRGWMNDIGSGLSEVRLVGPASVALLATTHADAALDFGRAQRKYRQGDTSPEAPELEQKFKEEAVRQNVTREAFVTGVQKVLGISDEA